MDAEGLCVLFVVLDGGSRAAPDGHTVVVAVSDVKLIRLDDLGGGVNGQDLKVNALQVSLIESVFHAFIHPLQKLFHVSIVLVVYI